MPSTLNTFWLCAVMLAALVLRAPAAPAAPAAPSDSPAGGDPSGEEEEDVTVASDLLSDSAVWDSILGATKRHKKEFEDEFNSEVKYHFLEHYETSSLPAGCPSSNFNKEACLHRLAQGLHTYMVLFKYVEQEYPNSLILSEAKYHSGNLINLIKQKMKRPEQVSALNSSQEQQLLTELEKPDTFQRKMTAHSILRRLHTFLVDGKRAVTRREMSRGSMANRDMAP